MSSHLLDQTQPTPAQVMIAACDTFRSGAVEQLKTHCARLQVRPLRCAALRCAPLSALHRAAPQIVCRRRSCAVRRCYCMAHWGWEGLVPLCCTLLSLVPDAQLVHAGNAAGAP